MSVELERARHALDMFRQSEAIDLLTALIGQEPDNADAHALLGIAYAYSQKEFEALEHLAPATASDDFPRFAKLLSEHFDCRRRLAAKLGVNDEKGVQAWNTLTALGLGASDDPNVGVKLSACLIVKNEEKNLDRCLRSLQGIADEVVVVDTGSVDRTVEIAESYGATIGHFEWTNDFAAARNESLRLATGQWALWIDADEEVAEGSKKAIFEGLIRPQFGGYFIRIVNFMSAESDANQYVHTPVRLFRRLPSVCFEGRIHEQVIPSLKELELPCATLSNATLNHYGYQPEAMAEKDKLNRTVSMLEREVEESPTDPFHWFNLANAYSVGRSPEKAAQAAYQAVCLMDNEAPYGAVAYQILASSLNSQGLSDDAIKVCVEAVERGFGVIIVHFELAHALFKRRQYNEALAAIDDVIDMAWPQGLTGDFGVKTHKSHVLKGQILTALGRLEEADEALAYALGVDPTFPLALFAAGCLRERQNRLPEAALLFGALSSDPLLAAPSLHLMGKIESKLGNEDRATEAFGRAFALEPRDTESWLGWVNGLESTGRFEEAVAAYEAYGKSHPMTAEVLVNYARALAASGKTEQAEQAFQEGIRHFQSYPNGYFNYGDFLYRAGDFFRAAEVYQAGLRLVPQHADGWFVLGNCFAQLGVVQGAEVAYTEALKLNPEHEGSKANLEVVRSAA